jgi:hypothetical protein
MAETVNEDETLYANNKGHSTVELGVTNPAGGCKLIDLTRDGAEELAYELLEETGNLPDTLEATLQKIVEHHGHDVHHVQVQSRSNEDGKEFVIRTKGEGNDD